MNFNAFEEYLRELQHGYTDKQSDKQIEVINPYQLFWIALKKRKLTST